MRPPCGVVVLAPLALFYQSLQPKFVDGLLLQPGFANEAFGYGDHLPFASDLTTLWRNHSAKTSMHRPSLALLGLGESRRSRKPQREKPLLWLHIHKAGGTFMCLMAQLAGEHVVLPNENCNWLKHDGYKDSGHIARGATCERRADFFKRLHFTWGQVERELWAKDQCFQDFDYGVMLRRPEELIRSMIDFHAENHDAENQQKPKHGKRWLKLLQQRLRSDELSDNGMEIGQDHQWKFMDNFQTRVLASAMEVAPGGINASHLATAEALLARFRVVARLEDLPTEKDAIFSALGWGQEMQAHVGEKRNAQVGPHWLFTQEELSWLREVNKYDLALYEGHSSRQKAVDRQELIDRWGRLEQEQHEQVDANKRQAPLCKGVPTRYWSLSASKQRKKCNDIQVLLESEDTAEKSCAEHFGVEKGGQAFGCKYLRKQNYWHCSNGHACSDPDLSESFAPAASTAATAILQG